MIQNSAIDEIASTFDINTIYVRSLLYSANIKTSLADIQRVLAEKPKPFVKWVGGKRQLLQQFKDRKLYPPEAFDPIKNTYHEPFAGGGAVFFDLLPRKAVLSDINTELITTYNVIKNDVEALIKALSKHYYDKDYFLKIRAQNPQKLSDIAVAARFIFLNRTCFNGLYRVNSKGQFNVPFGKYKNPKICDAENLQRVSKALQNVSVYNEDYTAVLKRAKKGDFIYFDPPYHPLSTTSSFTSYTANGFSTQDQIALRDVFVQLHKRGCFVMLSNSSAPFIKKIYSEINDPKIKIHNVYAGRSVNSTGEKRGKINEVLVTNY